MNFIRHTKINLFFLALGFFWSCANQTQPTGGPKDETPPVLLSVVPADQSVNYSGKQITLEFNEFVKADKLNQQLIITPRFDVPYNVKQNKNVISLVFEENFEDSTTYTFNFRESIKDLTEGNAATNLIIAFSTGDYLDSLSLSGKVDHLLLNKPAEEFLVGLFKYPDTLNLFNSKPLYSTKTTADGIFEFQNLKNDLFNIYAYQDKNDNLLCESDKESHGFLTDPITLDNSLDSIQIYVQQIDVRPLRIVSSRPNGKYFELKFNKYITSYNLDNLSDSIPIFSSMLEKNHMIRIYDTNNTNDSLTLEVSVFDSLLNNITDTINIFFPETSRSSVDFIITERHFDFFPENNFLLGKLSFSKPVQTFNTDSLLLQLDSVKFISAVFSKSLWNISRDVLTLETTLHDSIVITRSNFIDFKSSTFISIEKDSIAPLRGMITIQKLGNFGIVHIKINTEELFHAELIDLKGKIAMSGNTSNISFKYITPGDYKIRLLIDTNKNGQWDPANFYQNKLSEPVVFFRDPDSNIDKLTIRPNWELGPYNIDYQLEK